MKNLDISVLLDYYGSLLPDKQRQLAELYYYEDLSLSEISENEGITRQGVRDAIKRAESTLTETEQKLGLVRRMNEISRYTDIIEKCITDIDSSDDEQTRHCLCSDGMENIRLIRNILE